MCHKYSQRYIRRVKQYTTATKWPLGQNTIQLFKYFKTCLLSRIFFKVIELHLIKIAHRFNIVSIFLFRKHIVLVRNLCGPHSIHRKPTHIGVAQIRFASVASGWGVLLAVCTASVMFRNVLGRLVTGTARVHCYAKRAPVNQRIAVASVWARGLSDVTDEVSQSFDTFLLEVLVCPLSKKPLRWVGQCVITLLTLVTISTSWFHRNSVNEI